MKRMIFLMLMLLIVSAASMNAQVRIGGMDNPHPSAVLDLNENDDANTGTLGLALPRVELTAIDAIPSGMSAPATGLLVYNTNPDLGEGIYYWSGGAWVKIPNSSGTTYAADGSSLSLSGSTFSIANGGVTTTKIADTHVTLDKLATGSVNSDKIVDGSIESGDLKDEAVTSAKIANGTIAVADLSAMGATASGQVLKYNGTAWAAASLTAAEVGGGTLADCPYVVLNGVFTQETAGYIEASNLSNASTIQALFNRGGNMCLAQFDIVGSYDWTDARYACENTFGSGWRLPNIAELSNITASRANLNTSESEAGRYWSSTPYSSWLQWHWYYYDGTARQNWAWGMLMSIRCVRSL
jgi:hypothetical protein